MPSPEWWTRLPKWVQEPIEQVGHALAGAAIGGAAAGILLALDAASGWVWAAGTGAALASGIARELLQNWGDAVGDVWDAVLDLLVWSAGGPLGVWIATVIASGVA